MTALSKRRPKLTFANLWHQLYIVAGVFLVTTLFIPIQAKAQALNPPSVELSDKQSDSRLDNLKYTFGFKKSLLNEKEEEYKVVEKDVKAVADTKASLVADVDAMKAEVEELKAKVAEKQRLEALRIVQVTSSAPNSAGNTYAGGNCTWYAKSKRPDLPNMMGNAKFWYASAKAQGFKVGTLAKTNAIGVSFNGWAGHVVYVEAWHEDGTVTISDMNYAGLGVVTRRIAPASEFVYIYERA